MGVGASNVRGVVGGGPSKTDEPRRGEHGGGDCRLMAGRRKVGGGALSTHGTNFGVVAIRARGMGVYIRGGEISGSSNLDPTV